MFEMLIRAVETDQLCILVSLFPLDYIGMLCSCIWFLIDPSISNIYIKIEKSERCWVAAWGSYLDRQREVDLPLLSREQCIDRLGPAFQARVPNTNLYL